jgi:hypothetical protein
LKLNSDCPFGKDSYTLHLQVGKTTSNIKLKGFEADMNGDRHLFSIE